MPLPALDPTQHHLAVTAGEAWASSFADDLRARRRAIVGGWPGTMREARAWVVATLQAEGAPIALDQLPALSRTAYGAARTRWLAVSERDVEE